jgi:hypothetical protein
MCVMLHEDWYATCFDAYLPYLCDPNPNPSEAEAPCLPKLCVYFLPPTCTSYYLTTNTSLICPCVGHMYHLEEA